MHHLQPYQPPRSRLAGRPDLEPRETVALLLGNLFQREEATARSILDCLYEVAAGHLIDQKIPVRALRWPLKGVARYSKPVFRLFALRWFKKHCPDLITEWLFNYVRSGQMVADADLAGLEDSAVIDVTPISPTLSPLVLQQAAEINALRGRIGWLTGTLVITLTLVSVNWLTH
ncbi:MAG: hypothetical protein KGQ93_07565 [Cyanobacteria bacterium REEB459]|nr:hypothetical protein [Cyanobacteria bacterium REEB459]